MTLSSYIKSSALAGFATVSLSLAFVGPAFSASDELIAAATEEGRVVWYTTLIIDQAARPLAAAFEAKYPGITVDFARAGSGETALKIINEGQAGNPQSDVFDGTSTYSSVGPAGMVESYVPDSVADYPDSAKDENGQWHALNLYFLTAAYNTDLVSAEDAPQTYEDLLDPEWKGQIVWSAEPEPAAAPGFLGNMLMTMGEEDGLAYIEQLKGQEITNMIASQRAVMDRVIAGDFALCLMCFSHHAVISSGQGAPVEWIRMNPVINLSSLMGLTKGGPNPNAGKLFIDFIFSVEGQQVLAEAGYIPSHPDVPALNPELKPDGSEQSFTARTINPAMVDEMLPGWLELMNENFL